MLQQPSGRFSLISRTRRYSANGGAVARVWGLCLWTNRRVAFRLSARREARTWVKRQRGRTLSSTSTSTLTWTSLTSCRVVRVKSRPTPRHTWPQFSHPHPTLPHPPSCVPPPRPPPIPHPGGLQQIAIALRTAGHKPRNWTQHSSVSSAQSSGETSHGRVAVKGGP